MTDKHESVLIKKKFRKTSKYRCCIAPSGNKNKFSSRYCCTYPMVYKRYDISLCNKQEINMII